MIAEEAVLPHRPMSLHAMDYVERPSMRVTLSFATDTSNFATVDGGYGLAFLRMSAREIEHHREIPDRSAVRIMRHDRRPA